MKRTDKGKQSLRVRVPLVASALSKPDKAVEAIDVYNLRPRHAEGPDCQLEPVGDALCISSLGGYKPLCKIAFEGGERLLCARGTDLALADPAAPDSRPAVYGGALPAAALCALRQNAVTAIVMTADGPAEVSTAAGVPAVRSLACDFPPIILRAEEGGTVLAQVGSRRLSQPYGTGERLGSRDAEAVAADLSEAYRSMCATAAAAGTMIQPALARYKLLDSEGHLLYTSATVLVGLPEGAQCAGTVRLYSSDRQTLGGYSLQARTWRLRADIFPAEGPRCADVAACELYMSPLFHPYSRPGAVRPVYTGRADSESSPFISLMMPGAENALGDAYPAACKALLMKAVTHIDMIEERVATIMTPFGAAARSELVAVSPAGDVEASTAALHKALERPLPAHTRTEALLRAPHCLAAACVAADVSTAVWGRLRVRRARPYSVAIYAATTADQPWQAATHVYFADGSGVSLSESHSGGAPVALSPVVCYPSPDAVAMSITVSSGGSIRHAEFSLQPDSSGLRSVGIAAGAAHVELESGSGRGGASESPAAEFPDALALAPAGQPLAIDATATGAGDVLALSVKEGRDETWDFGRSRFCAVCADGIYSLGVSAGRLKLSLKQLSGLRVGRGDAWLDTGCGDSFGLAGGRLYRRDSKGLCEVMDSSEAVFLCYDAGRGELGAYGADGTATVYCRRHDWRKYRRDTAAVSGMVRIEGETYATGEAGLYVPGREDRRLPRAVALEFATSPAGGEPALVSRVEASLQSGGMGGYLRTYGSSLDGGTRWLMVSSYISGLVKSPVGATLTARPARRIVTQLSAEAGPALVIDSIKISYRKV